MARPARLVLYLLVVWLTAAGVGPASAAEEFVFDHENVMGTSLELRINADSAAAATAAEQCVLHEIDRLSAIFSGYDPTSEFSRWQQTRNQPIRVSSELFEVLQACDRWRTWTTGAFDPRVEALTRLWSDCEKQGRLPTTEETTEARRLLVGDPWRLDPEHRTAERLSNGPLSLNAIAKGYIVGRACDAAMNQQGVRGLLLNVGGDMRVCGEMERIIGVANPKHDSETSEPLLSIQVRDRAVATSGNSQRGFRIGGRWYSHIFDPRTGRPVATTISATVVTDSSTDADAMATALNVLTVAESLDLARSIPGLECLLVTEDGRVTRSDGWNRYEKVRPPVAALALADEAATDEVVIKFELNNASASRGFRRQYVAIWVEDKEGFPVRTLTLWGRGRWVADLKRWSQKDQARRLVDETNLRETISRPTRPPGKYEVIWDGKDNHGKRLDPGEYSIYIEAAREHGTYQSIHTQVNLAGKAFAEELKGNVEIRSASIEYRRKDQGK